MTQRKPNVLLLFTDQHRADVVGYENHPDILTPNLDTLAAQGVHCSHALCQDGVCVPSRTSMMSGLYPRTTGCLSNGDLSPILQRVYPMAQAFADAGYFTAAYGKRHLPMSPYATDNGWRDHHGFCSHESPGASYDQWLTDPAHKAAWARDWHAEWGPNPSPMASQVTQLPPDKTMEAFTAAHTIKLIHEMAKSDQPFFCWSSFYRPHQPYTPLPEYFARFDTSHWGAGRRADDGLHMPPTLRETVENLPPGVPGHTAGSETWPVPAARENEQIWRNYIASYYACMEEIDHHIGRILAELHASGLDENTIVIYASDHGEFVGAHGMPEKAATGHNIYLDTLRVPLIFRFPGRFRQGAVCDDLIELVDLYPTLVELAGLRLPDLQFPLAGRSLVETLACGRPLDRQFSVSENWTQSSVITPAHVLGVWQDPIGKHMDQRSLFSNMLFDLAQDPHQTRNVYDDPAYQAVRDRLTQCLAQWQAATDDIGRQYHIDKLLAAR